MFFVASILTRIEGLMSTWGYPVLFGLLFSCGLGLPLPEDIPLLLAGYFVANAKMHLAIASICAWLGIIGGDVVLYNLGKRYGLEITRVPVIGKHVTRERIEYAEKLFERYGTWVVGVGRLFAGIRGAMVIAAGAIRFNFVKFLIADGIAAILSGGMFIALGYWAGKKVGDLEAIREKVQHYEHYVIGGIVLIVLVIIAWKLFRKKTHTPPVVDKTLEKVVEKVEQHAQHKSEATQP